MAQVNTETALLTVIQQIKSLSSWTWPFRPQTVCVASEQPEPAGHGHLLLQDAVRRFPGSGSPALHHGQLHRPWPGICRRSSLIVFSSAPQLNNWTPPGTWKRRASSSTVSRNLFFSRLPLHSSTFLPPSRALSAHGRYTPSSVWQTSSYSFAPWPHPRGPHAPPAFFRADVPCLHGRQTGGSLRSLTKFKNDIRASRNSLLFPFKVLEIQLGELKIEKALGV